MSKQRVTKTTKKVTPPASNTVTPPMSKQDRLNQEEEGEYEQLMAEQRARFNEILGFTIDNALTYNCTETEADDWLEIPAIIPRLIVELQRHTQIVSKHLIVESEKEQTMSLRQYSEDRFKTDEETVEKLRNDIVAQLDFLDGKRTELTEYVKNIDSGATAFRHKYGTEMAKPKLITLIPGLTEKDVAWDTEQAPIDVDPESNPEAGVARTVTLQQLTHLFNVCLGRSRVQQRVTDSEAATRVLSEKVESLESWKADIEARIMARENEVDLKIEATNERITVFKADSDHHFEGLHFSHKTNEQRYKEIKNTFRENAIDRQNLHTHQNKMEDDIKQKIEFLDERLDLGTKKTYKFVEEIERFMSQSVEVQNKNILNNKHELQENLTHKHLQMVSQFAEEMKTVKKKYEEAVFKVQEATDQLKSLFRKKVSQIKEKSVLFYAQMEMKMKESNDEVLKISTMFRDFQENLQGPTRKYEAQIFSLNKTVEQEGTETKTEVNLIKNVLSNLIHALEDKTASDLLQGQTQRSSTDLITYVDGGIISNFKSTTNAFQKRKQSQPPTLNGTGPNMLPSISRSVTPSGDYLSNQQQQLVPFVIQDPNATLSDGKMTQNKIFMKRISQIKDKMTYELERGLGQEHQSLERMAVVPKAGVFSQRKRSEEMLSTNASRALINAERSKSELGSSALTQYPLQRTNQNSNASILLQQNPKTVREWAHQRKNSELSRNFTDGNITSSLMKKAQVTALSTQIDTQPDGVDGGMAISESRHNLNASALDNQVFSQKILPNMMGGEQENQTMLLSMIPSSQSPMLQQLFTTQQPSAERERQSSKRKKNTTSLNIDPRIDLSNNYKTHQGGLIPSYSTSTVQDGIVGEAISPSGSKPQSTRGVGSTIERSKVANQNHALYFKDNQKELQKLTDARQSKVQRRPSEDVPKVNISNDEIGQLEQFETQLANQKALFQQQVQAKQAVIRNKNQTKKQH